MVLTGSYVHTIDAKQRLAIPLEIRRQLLRAADGVEGDAVVLYATLDEKPGLVRLYNEPVFEELASRLDDTDMEPDEFEDYVDAFYSAARSCQLDPQGRVRLPADLLEQAGLSGQVAVLGSRDHIQLRDPQAWEQHLAQVRERNGGAFVNPRKVLRSRRMKK